MKFKKILGFLFLFSAGGMICSFSETKFFTVKKHVINIFENSEPRNFENNEPANDTDDIIEFDKPESIRILHISDVHARKHDFLKYRFIKSLIRYKPDLIINTGDNISCEESFRSLSDSYRDLLGIPGVFVFGSNDYKEPMPLDILHYFKKDVRKANSENIEKAQNIKDLPTERMRSLFTGKDTKDFDTADGIRRSDANFSENSVAGRAHADRVDSNRETGGKRADSNNFEIKGNWIDLNNSRCRIKINDRTIEFVGVDDPHINRDEFPPAENIENQKEEKETGALLKIGVTHAPYKSVLKQMADDGVDIVFAGHTHGGQIQLPLYGAIITNCDIEKKYVKGLHYIDSQSDDSNPSRIFSYEPVSSSGGRTPFDISSNMYSIIRSRMSNIKLKAAGAASKIPSNASDIRSNTPKSSAAYSKPFYLNVSGGIGSSPKFPFRLFNRPEVSVIELRYFPRKDRNRN